jgi:hypothetical protein
MTVASLNIRTVLLADDCARAVLSKFSSPICFPGTWPSGNQMIRIFSVKASCCTVLYVFHKACVCLSNGIFHFQIYWKGKKKYVALGGLVVIVLVTGPNVCGFKPGKRRWIFKGDKSPNTTYFGGKVKPPVHCSKILRHVKNPYSMKEIIRLQNSRQFSPRFSCFETRCLCWLVPDSSGG